MQAEGQRFDPATLHQYLINSDKIEKKRKKQKKCTFLSYQKRQIDIVNRVIHETFLVKSDVVIMFFLIENCLSKSNNTDQIIQFQ